MQNPDLELIQTEANRLAVVETGVDFAEERRFGTGLHFRFATAHVLVTLFSLGRAAESSWIFPAVLALASGWDYCRSLAIFAAPRPASAATWQLAAMTATVVMAATTAIVVAFAL